MGAVRRGDDHAFERLYERYHRRIAGYVYGMVGDYGRAEDVTQDVFISALRRMRQTDRPIAFKPWIYEIAKNACIDQFRRSRRTEEVSFDADEGMNGADSRLVTTGPGPEAAVDTKQSLDHLRGAFGGLSETHHQILVMRELEGLSYREIGERLGMSRPSVESTLFRARRRLGEEYEELVSGERCVRVAAIIDAAGHGRLGTRDQRKLAKHVAHCQSCRRAARKAGVPAARGAAATRIAAFLPLPAVLRRRLESDDAGLGTSGLTMGQHGPAMAHWSTQLTASLDPAIAGWAKAAVAAAAVAVSGLGVGGSNDVGQVGERFPAAVTAGPAAVAAPLPAPESRRSAEVPLAPVTDHDGAGPAPSATADQVGRRTSAAVVQKSEPAARTKPASVEAPPALGTPQVELPRMPGLARPDATAVPTAGGRPGADPAQDVVKLAGDATALPAVESGAAPGILGGAAVDEVEVAAAVADVVVGSTGTVTALTQP